MPFQGTTLQGRPESTLTQRYEAVKQQIDQALSAALRNQSGLTLVAVSKRQPVGGILKAYELGVRHFAESMIQEGIPKIRACPDDIFWHFIGHLQKNKVRKAVVNFQFLHSVDSLSLLQRIDTVAGEERVRPKVLLQVNYALDSDKFGLHPEAVQTVLGSAMAMDHIECIGLMAIPPLSADTQKVESYFQGVAALRDQLKGEFPNWPGKLSLGMSDDFAIAIQAGSNFIRIGTLLFGERT